jgi:lysozyme
VLKKRFKYWNTFYLLASGALILYVLSRFGKQKKQIVNFDSQTYQKNLLAFLIAEEGIRNRVYKDQAGKDTIGIGHLIKPGEERFLSVTLSPKEIEDLFFSDIAQTENTIKSLVKVPLNENQKIALVSLVFNIGPTAFKNSTLLKLLNDGDYNKASLEFPRWVYITLNGNKQISKGLQNRRFREQLLFNS